MAMTLMRQLDLMNKSMDDHGHCNRKQCTNKSAKKHAKKQKHRALKGLNDHGGKAGGGELVAAAVVIIASATIASAKIAAKLNI